MSVESKAKHVFRPGYSRYELGMMTSYNKLGMSPVTSPLCCPCEPRPPSAF